MPTDAARAGTEIVVPGSISNLGPGFDALSVAVQLYLRVRIIAVRPYEPDVVEWAFVGMSPNGDNRIATAFRLARARVGTPAPGLRVEVRSDIPQTAGLGSSAAASIAGLRLYETVTAATRAKATPGNELDLLALATELEGHPDNAAAALLGGLATSCQRTDGRIIARSRRWPPDLRFVVATPDTPLETAEARRVLPASLPLSDAVFNLQRALLLVEALASGRYDDLREAMRDRWHQPVRAPLVPGLADAIALDDPAILGVCLSGAGPSIAAIASGDPSRAAALLDGIYQRLGMRCTIRTLEAHQPK